MSTPPGEVNKPRRFIAGAVCPRCGVMDRIVVSGDGETRECVACGYTDARPAETPGEIATRVTRAASRRTETQAEAVKLMDPAAGNPSASD